MFSASLPSLTLPVLALRLVSPAVVLLTALSLFAVSHVPESPSSITSVVVAVRIPRRALILSLLCLTALSYFLDGLTLAVSVVLSKRWPDNFGLGFDALLGLTGFAVLAIGGGWSETHGPSLWLLRRLKLAITSALVMDTGLAVMLGLMFHEYISQPHIPEYPRTAIFFQVLHLIFPTARVLLQVPLLWALYSPRTLYTPIRNDDASERNVPTASSFLLPPDANDHPETEANPGTRSGGKYGTFRNTSMSSQSSTSATRPATPTLSGAKRSKTDIALEPSWAEIGRRLRRIMPYLWPSKNVHLQLLAIACILILLLGRVINFALPFTLGALIRSLQGITMDSPWPYLYGYVGLTFLQGSGGLSVLRETIWAPVLQYSDREMSQLSFDHLLNLSFAWHTRRKTGEVLRILDRGSAINSVFELLLFNIAPTLIDIAVAIVAFFVLFEWTLALMIFVVMTAYIIASVTLTQRRARLKRQMNDRDTVTRGIHTDCLLNYETVKYFGGEAHEGARYREAVEEYQILEYEVIWSLSVLNIVQNVIITLGLLVGSLIVAHRVTEGKADSSSFVIFITYLAQLYGPLNRLGSVYRSVNRSLIDTERLLALLDEPTEVNDQPNAPDLVVTDGEIVFDNVQFSYDGQRPALRGVSFKIPKGSSVALVGESGAGKSTIFRLLYRFFDIDEGSGRILIDGQDIRGITQKSLRGAIGVVPQDPVLFNTTVGSNISYGKFGASEEEIVAVAQSAQMHDRIMRFYDGYNTKVGERGVRLSGGEKQRIAIARALLKNPPILLLDEATSALDTSTEKDIQNALQNLVKGRSSLTVAHRLSTIASVDIILVLKDGQIVEQGSHQELLQLNGVFAAMWANQISTSGGRAGFASDSKSRGGFTQQKEQSLIEFPDKVDVDANIARTDLAKAEPDVKSLGYDVNEDIAEPPSTHAVAFPSTDENENAVEPPIITSEPVAPADAPINFPTPAPTLPEVISTVAGVKFDEAFSATLRSGTPDLTAEPRRKRISSQNFQRLVRRISQTTKRPSSVASILPSFIRDQSSRASGEHSRDEDSGAQGETKTRKKKDRGPE